MAQSDSETAVFRKYSDGNHKSTTDAERNFTARPRAGTFTTGNFRNDPRHRDQDPAVASHARTRRSGAGSAAGCMRRAAVADGSTETMASSRKSSSCTTYRELQTSEARGQFSCLLCLEPSFSTSPRHLDCCHAFCERCLTDYRRLYCVTSADDDDTVGAKSRRLVACPTCRHVTRLSAHGAPVAPLPSSLTGNGSCGDSMRTRKVSQALTDATHRCDACICRKRIEPADFYCSKCLLNFCNDCKSAHDAQTLFSTHTVIHISNKDTVSLGCDIHGGRNLCQYFCYDCDVPACSVCLLHEHGPGAGSPPHAGGSSGGGKIAGGHRTAKLRDALAARRDALKTLLNAFGPRLDRLELKARRLSGNAGSLRGSRTNTAIKLEEQTSSRAVSVSTPASTNENISIPLLRHPQKQANNDVRESVTDDDDDDAAKDGVGGNDHTVRFFIINNVSRATSRASDDDDDDAASVESNDAWMVELIVEQIGRLRRLFDISTRLLELSQSRRLLTVHTEVAGRLQTVLDVELPQLITAVNDRLEAEPTPVASRSSTDPGSSSSIASNGVSGLRSRHSSTVSGTSKCDVDDVEAYEMTGCMSLLVRPKLVWKAERQQQRGGDLLGELWNPCGAAFLPRDDGLVVAEYDMASARNNKICIFDARGKRVNVLAQGQIQPLGVAVTREGHIAVTDCQGKRVKIMTLTGQTISDIGKGQFGWPYGIAVNAAGQLVVTDAFSDSVSVYGVNDGKRVRQFGSSGTRDCNFRNPYHVTVDTRDNILVADSGNDCVKAFDATGGRFLFRCDVTNPGGPLAAAVVPLSDVRSGRRRQKRGGRLRGPRGLTIDLRGNILVADDCSRVCMFNATGRYVRNLLTDEDSVKYPEAVNCSRNGSGLMAVTEWNPNNMYAVKVFTLYE